MRVTPDDEVYRVNTVWLGPQGFTLPWTARYIAYATGLAVFLLILLGEALLPISVGVPPFKELGLAIFLTWVVLGYVDHERPLGAVRQTFMADLRAPRPVKARTARPTTTIRVVEQRGDQIYTTRSTL
jgi:hypothetical protein